jgi:hyaluronate lyase
VKGYFSSPKNMYVAQKSESFLNSPSIPERGETVKNYQFRDMDRVVHKQTSFTFAVSCYSNRIANYESINQENLKGWYTGSGMTYLYLDSDLDHYSDAFWPTVNSYKMPGTTIDRRSRPDTIEGRLGQATVGGVSAGGSGVSCMQLNMDGSQLTAKKSWFMFGGYLTCLGTDIHSSSPYAVDTIIENRNLGASGANKVTVGYRSGNIVDMPGAIGTIGSAKWINIAGVAGYVILNTKAFIEGVRERREGSWRDINSTTRTITTKYQRNYLRFSFRHGANVNGGAYAYTILPKASVSFTRNYANKPIARVLNNNKSVQCVTCTFSNAVTLTGAVFWSAGTSHDGQKAVASSSAPLCLLVRKAANVVEITYSDPTSTATSDIEIRVFTKNARSVISKPDEDIVSTTNNSITIRFRPAKLNGASRTVQVRA